MISIIITSYKEPNTIGKAIQSILKNNLKDYEILVTAPDKETLNAAKKYSIKNKNIKLIKDLGKGKPLALNLAVSKAKGEIIVLTDGDVYVRKNSINFLLESFKNKQVGAVSGNPVSLNSKNNMLGFWAYVLTKIANERRKKALALKKRFFCSGYLFAIRKKLFPILPEELLSEDGFISHNVYEHGYDLDYSEKSEVYIKYPSNIKDWIIQKKRSAGGYNQINKLIKIEIRSFKKESLGVFGLLKYVSNFKEFLWMISLFLIRIYLWILIYKEINLQKKSHKSIWKRVESTK
jgi:cellulose synthase/poly-beta-1,6-N-acetylglucosamine synthase-like glycosyltransferase